MQYFFWSVENFQWQKLLETETPPLPPPKQEKFLTMR